MYDKTVKGQFRIWELKSVQNFLEFLSNKFILARTKDKIVWQGGGLGQFTVKASFSMLEGVSNILAPVSMLSDPYVPSKISFFFHLGT